MPVDIAGFDIEYAIPVEEFKVVEPATRLIVDTPDRQNLWAAQTPQGFEGMGHHRMGHRARRSCCAATLAYWELLISLAGAGIQINQPEMI
ncbi:MAG: 2-C-methyl-D-erythritol 4-phosphate cytidylyltransferase [Oscillatoria princeps RMCB-10]|nr:2-C-methyl-D-erythritol 4-phosphate cytidylyltransferase [Oscillatoria princeps RMCB-10]